MLYLVLYNTSIKKLLDMQDKKIIQLRNETEQKLKQLKTNKNIRYLLRFRKYNFEKQTTETDKTTNEIYNIFVQYGNKNLIYGFKIINESEQFKEFIN